jgi:hypothetical protein
MMTDAINIFKNPEKRKTYEREYDEYYNELKGKKADNYSQGHTQVHAQTSNYNKKSNQNIEWIKFAIFQLQGVRNGKETELDKMKKHLVRAIEIYSISEEQQKKDYDKKLKNIDERYYDKYYYELKEKKGKLSQNKKGFNLFFNKKKQENDLNSTTESIETIETQRQENIDRVTTYFQIEAERRQADLNNIKTKISSLEKKMNEINGKLSMLEDILNQDQNVENIDEILKSVKF